MSEIKVHVSAVDIRRAQNAIRDELDRRVRWIAKDKTLQEVVTDRWAARVTRFVPRSDKDYVPGGHLQDNYYVDRGNVVWHRYNSRGEDIAGFLYEGGRGRWHIRADGATEYGPHEPQSHWDAAVAPGTDEWSALMREVKPYIQEAMKRSG